MNIQTRTVGTIVGILVLGSSLFAQQGRLRWGMGRTPDAGACFYRDADFRGEYFCVRVGEPVPMVPGDMNDGISSIRLFGRAGVTVYQDVSFRGRSARFDTNVRNLGREGWNDQISSIQVTTSSPIFNPARPPMWGGGEQPMPGEGACFYKDADFRGERFCVPRGASYAMLPPGFNDQITSVRVSNAVVIIFQDANFGGRSTKLTGDTRNLGDGWNDRISSFRVY
jgi:Peptidase inhibitor family I36